MNFSSPEKVASVIYTLKDAELRRAPNRTLIDTLFNGSPPYTQSEAEENKIQWNVNWGEGPDLLLQGREQLENAHLSTDYAFTVTLPDAPKSKASEYGQKITRRTNKLIRESLPYFHTQRMKWGSVILHGIGPQMWHERWGWRPNFVGIDDLLVPTDTLITLENLNHFAVRRRMSPGQLFRKTFGLPESKRDPAWNLKAVAKVLDQYKDVNQNQNSWNWAEHPEKMQELWKQNSMYYETDAVPVIWMWDFFYQEDESPSPCWYRKIILDRDCVPGNTASADDPIVYLHDQKTPYARELSHILQIQFIDGNNVPPFMYHSTRGLGLRLHDAVHGLNRLRCQFMQKVFEEMMLLFRAADPMDRSRLDKIYLGMNYGIIPDGLSFVTRDQRYQIDPRLVEMQIANLKQLVGEGSQQYTQDIDMGTNKERTAFEVSTLLQQTTRLTGSMLNLSYLQEWFSYKEICRRLTDPKTADFDSKKLQAQLVNDGVPKRWIDSAKWDIEVVRVLGSGNTQIEQAQAQAMLNIRPMLNPEAQTEVLNTYIYSITHDPKRANRLAPIGAQTKVTDTVHDTDIAYGAMLGGSVVKPKDNLIPIEVATTMLQQMGITVSTVMQTDGIGTPQIVNGLVNAARYTDYYIQQIAQDPAQKELARMLTDKLNKLMAEVKGMKQRQMQQQQAAAQKEQNNGQLEAMQKMQTNAAMAQQKMQQKDISHKQKLAQKNQDFAAQLQRENIKSVIDARNESMTAATQAAAAASTAGSEE